MKAPPVLNDPELHKALADFANAPNKVDTPLLNPIIENVCLTGVTCFEWNYLKSLVAFKVDQVLREFNSQNPDCPDVNGSRFDDEHPRLLNAILAFSGAPFTLQRICELITEPHRYYRSTRKLISAFSKLLNVTLTMPRYDPSQEHFDDDVDMLVDGKSDSQGMEVEDEHQGANAVSHAGVGLGLGNNRFAPNSIGLGGNQSFVTMPNNPTSML